MNPPSDAPLITFPQFLDATDFQFVPKYARWGQNAMNILRYFHPSLYARISHTSMDIFNVPDEAWTEDSRQEWGEFILDNWLGSGYIGPTEKLPDIPEEELGHAFEEE